MYTLEAPGYNLGELRALQDWYIKFTLQNTEGVSEVASFCGFQKRYQINIDLHKLVYYGIPLMEVTNAIASNNRAVGGSIYEINASGYLVRGLGYITDINDIKDIAVGTYKSVPITINDVASVQVIGDLRLGIADLNGKGEVVGGIVIRRYGKNAQILIDRVKTGLTEI